MFGIKHKILYIQMFLYETQVSVWNECFFLKLTFLYKTLVSELNTFLYKTISLWNTYLYMKHVSKPRFYLIPSWVYMWGFIHDCSVDLGSSLHLDPSVAVGKSWLTLGSVDVLILPLNITWITKKRHCTYSHPDNTVDDWMWPKET